MGDIVRLGKVNATTSISKRKPSAVEPEYIAHIPPPPDEDYWAALLNEGEALSSAEWDHDHDTAHGHEPSDSGAGANDSTFDASQHDWSIAQQAYEADQAVELLISGANRGGLLVEWNSLHGFVPASQLVDFPTIADPQARRAQLALKIGQHLSLRIIEFDRAQSRLIFSERAAQVQPGTRATVLDSLRHSDVLSGWVTNVCDFGVFIDLGGLEGLIHISELSWGRVNHPRDLLSRGDAVQVYVMEVNREQGRVALSLKRMQPDPWETVERRYRVGEFITGQVTNIVDFGAFICIENGLEGLIHVSELAEGHFLHPRNVVSEGETIRARILNIDSQARRLGLSLREPSDELSPSAPESTFTDDSA
jgi:small subunit ribosomal protein S1